MPILKEECYNLNSMIGFLPKAKTLPRVLTTLSHCCTHPKLALRFVRSFQVVERVGPVAYLLALPKGMNMHPIFHVSVIWKAVGAHRSILPIPKDVRPGFILEINPCCGNRNLRECWLGV